MSGWDGFMAGLGFGAGFGAVVIGGILIEEAMLYIRDWLRR